MAAGRAWLLYAGWLNEKSVRRTSLFSTWVAAHRCIAADTESGIFEVLATSGDTHLGGEDFDNRVISHLLKVFARKTGVDASGDKRAVRSCAARWSSQARASSQHQVKVEVEGLHNGHDFSETLTRARFEELNLDLKRTLTPVQKVLDDAKLKKSDVDEIVLVGGSTRFPRCRLSSRITSMAKSPPRHQPRRSCRLWCGGPGRHPPRLARAMTRSTRWC